MTAAAIPNLFPGSPPTLGDSVMTPVNEQGTASFENYLSQAEMAPTEPVMQTEVPATVPTQEDSSGLKELFDLLSLLFGNTSETVQTGDETGELIQTGTEKSVGTATSFEQEGSSFTNGFISELQLILSLFQSLTGSIQNSQNLSSQTTDTQAEAAVAQDTGLVASPLAEQTSPVITPSSTVGTLIDAQIQKQQEQTASIAPGIELQNDIVQNDTISSSTDVFQKETPISPINSSENQFTKKMDEANDNLIQTTYQKAAPSAGTSSQAMKTDPNEDQIDLRLLTLSYRKNGDMDIREVKYSMTGEEGMALKEGLNKNDVKAPLNGPSDSLIQMTQATIHKKDGGEVSIKTIHLSSDFLQNNEISTQSNTSKLSSTNTLATATSDDVLTIDFNKNLDGNTSNQTDLGQNSGGQTGTQTNQTPTVGGTTPPTLQQGPYSGSQEQSLNDLVTAQVNEGISQALKMNKNRAVLHLNPPELGTVKVSITVSHNNHVQASFVADHPETRHILEANMQNLKDSLAQNGFSMSQVNVDVGGGFAQWSGSQQEQLTPFGMPSMWLGSRNQSTEEAVASKPSRVNETGVHVIA